MTKGFWEKLPRPIMAMAPLHDVTDTVFRQMIARKGRPDVMFTEFVSTDGLAHPASRQKMIERYLRFIESERPLVMQIWGTNPDFFESAARLAVERGFDGVDINMGCPEHSAVKHGACSALIEQPQLAQELIRAVQRGVQGQVPVSVKTRLGFRMNVIDEWMKHLLEAEPAVITIHGRTAKQMSAGAADWDSIVRAAAIARGSGTLVVGNGDVRTLDEAREKAKTYGVDGVMFGRAVFSNHWLFDQQRRVTPSREEKLQALVEHAELYEQTYFDNPSTGLRMTLLSMTHGNGRGFWTLRKHFRAYTSGFPGGKELRIALMQAYSTDDIRCIIDDWSVWTKG